MLWQDGTRSVGSSTEYEQVAAVDEETDVFPGDVGVFSGVTPNKIGVVQSMDAKKRTVRLRYLDRRTCLPAVEGPDSEEETVSGLEFDPHGPPPDAYGVRRGDIVLLMPESEANGAQAPIVPGLGESEVAAGLMPGGEQLRLDVRPCALFACVAMLTQTDCCEQISTLGLSYCQALPDNFSAPKAKEAPESLRWYGEVWDLLLTGEAEVRYPHGACEAVPVPRLVHLDDGADPDAAVDGDDGMALDGDEEDAEATDQSWETEDDDDEEGMEEEWSADEGSVTLEGERDRTGAAATAGSMTGALVGGDDNEADDSDDADFVMEDAGSEGAAEGDEARREADRRQSKRRKGNAPDAAGAVPEVKGWADEDDEEQVPGSAVAVAVNGFTAAGGPVPAADAACGDKDLAAAVESTSGSAPATATASSTETAVVSMPTDAADFEDWSRFEVLEEAPLDHHYIGERVLAPSKAFMSRVRKEHQVLATSLPREFWPWRTRGLEPRS